MVHSRVKIPSKIIQKYRYPNDTECLFIEFIELNFRKCKWLLYEKYRKVLDTYSNYDKVLIDGDFITEITEHYAESLLFVLVFLIVIN